ncbi:hypothetical protein FACS18949_12220 [Clostridia bacterium]|nr:hypothetical protein FACS18949_12220 [Clostridia bacterium]
MEDVKDGTGKLVCRADAASKAVEIVRKGQRTLVYLSNENVLKVVHNTLSDKQNK